MEKYFWREKNANKFIEEFTVISPTKQELLDEIVKKFYEKLEMINVIFDNTKRNEYLSKKSKTIPEGTPEIVIQQKIGTRVIIDFLQLIKDMCELKNLHLNLSDTNSNKNKEEIIISIQSSIKNVKKQSQESLVQIFYNIMNLINLLSLNYDKMECERQKVEEKEGSFYKGKFVIK